MDKSGEELREQKKMDVKHAANVLASLPETAGLDPFGMFCAITHPLCEFSMGQESEVAPMSAPETGKAKRILPDA